MTKREKMYQQIQGHGEQLLVIFPEATEKDPTRLCKKLLRLENKAHYLTTDSCNTGAEHHSALCTILGKVKAILCPDMGIYLKIFVNCDPRGYALKIDDRYMRENNLRLHQDWGGYGIIAPEFDGN